MRIVIKKTYAYNSDQNQISIIHQVWRVAPCCRSNHSSHFIRFRSHKSQPWRADDEGRKDSESIIHKKDANHSLSTNSISLLCSWISTSPLSPRPCSALLTPPTASRSLSLSPPLFSELSRAAPPFPKHNNSFQRRTQSMPFNALTAGCPAHALRHRAPLLLPLSETQRSHRHLL